MWSHYAPKLENRNGKEKKGSSKPGQCSSRWKEKLKLEDFSLVNFGHIDHHHQLLGLVNSFLFPFLVSVRWWKSGASCPLHQLDRRHYRFTVTLAYFCIRLAMAGSATFFLSSLFFLAAFVSKPDATILATQLRLWKRNKDRKKESSGFLLREGSKSQQLLKTLLLLFSLFPAFFLASVIFLLGKMENIQAHKDKLKPTKVFIVFSLCGQCYLAIIILNSIAMSALP